MPQTPDVTIMFTDVVGSTAILDRLGDEHGATLLRRHLSALRTVALRHRGTVIKSLGDGLMLTFADAHAATACAAAMQREVQRHRLADAHARDLQIRVGIHRGSVMREGDDCFGKNVVIASRLCDACPAGEVLISADVRALLRADVAPSRDLGTVLLRGIDRPIEAARLHWQLTADETISVGTATRLGHFPLTHLRTDQLAAILLPTCDSGSATALTAAVTARLSDAVRAS